MNEVRNNNAQRDWVEVKLIRQEHRLVNVINNFFRYRKSTDEYGKASKFALAWKMANMLIPAVAFGGIGLTAIFGVLIAIKANNLIGEQNNLLAVQSQLIEGQRRATLIFELTSILDELKEEQNSWLSKLSKQELEAFSQPHHSNPNKNPNKIVRRKLSRQSPSNQIVKIPEFRPSSALLGRLAALSRSLRPYKYLDVEGDGKLLIDSPVSPERAQLLITLLNANFHTQLADRFGAIFDYADLSNAHLTNTYIEGKSLNFARFENSNLTNSSLRYSSLKGAIFTNANLTGTDFSHSTLPEISAFKGSFYTSPPNFYGATVDNSDWMNEACVNPEKTLKLLCNNWKIVPPNYNIPPQNFRDIDNKIGQSMPGSPAVFINFGRHVLVNKNTEVTPN